MKNALTLTVTFDADNAVPLTADEIAYLRHKVLYALMLQHTGDAGFLPPASECLILAFEVSGPPGSKPLLSSGGLSVPDGPLSGDGTPSEPRPHPFNEYGIEAGLALDALPEFFKDPATYAAHIKTQQNIPHRATASYLVGTVRPDTPSGFQALDRVYGWDEAVLAYQTAAHNWQTASLRIQVVVEPPNTHAMIVADELLAEFEAHDQPI